MGSEYVRGRAGGLALTAEQRRKISSAGGLAVGIKRREALRKLRRTVVQLASSGLSMAEIGRRIGRSRERVRQILADNSA